MCVKCHDMCCLLHCLFTGPHFNHWLTYFLWLGWAWCLAQLESRWWAMQPPTQGYMHQSTALNVALCQLCTWSRLRVCSIICIGLLVTHNVQCSCWRNRLPVAMLRRLMSFCRSMPDLGLNLTDVARTTSQLNIANRILI